MAVSPRFTRRAARPLRAAARVLHTLDVRARGLRTFSPRGIFELARIEPRRCYTLRVPARHLSRAELLSALNRLPSWFSRRDLSVQRDQPVARLAREPGHERLAAAGDEERVVGGALGAQHLARPRPREASVPGAHRLDRGRFLADLLPRQPDVLALRAHHRMAGAAASERHGLGESASAVRGASIEQARSAHTLAREPGQVPRAVRGDGQRGAVVRTAVDLPAVVGDPLDRRFPAREPGHGVIADVAADDVAPEQDGRVAVPGQRDAAALADLVLDLAVGGERAAAVHADRLVERGPGVTAVAVLGLLQVALVDPHEMDLA